MCLKLEQPSLFVEYQNNTHVSSIREQKWKKTSNTG